MKQWEDWIIFIGFLDEQYDGAVSAIGKWKKSLGRSGLDGVDLCRLSRTLSTGIRFYHSCCLGLGTMRVTDVGEIEAGWIDCGRLSNLPMEYEHVKDSDFSDTYEYPWLDSARVNFLNGGRLQVIGMTLGGDVVIDTFKEYGNIESVNRRMRELGDVGYCREFLETVRKNYARALLPPVPKGILKLPSAVRQGDWP